MGLCKCPKKKVTNLFCFEHRVNVCEHCLVESHASCAVQSYLAWLTDSDFDPNCVLCEAPLNERETVRLQCLHLFHWECLDGWASAHPANTAPAGFRCPTCREAIFPAPNQTSPMIEKFRSQLQRANWARAGLGLPLLPELNRTPAPPRFVVPQKAAVEPAAKAPVNPNYRASTPATVLEVDDSFSQRDMNSQFISRKKPMGDGREDSDAQPLLQERDEDLSSNKYKRRPFGEWMSRYVRSQTGGRGVAVNPFTATKRKLFVILLLIVGVITVLVVLTRDDSEEENANPFFDPLNNPNIRVAPESNLG